MTKIIINISKGNTINPIVENFREFIAILIVMLTMKINEFTRLLMKASFSFLFFAKKAM
ncbi:MAG TPA: hypothetical protein VMV43_09225 [Candidatus Nanopelagicaceae bacterium]|nr:hypothetical protein [Candidatus Nanopelagicaceae bacterium]